jgi:hypothetical protein
VILDMREDLESGDRVYTLRISPEEMVRARLQPFDRKLFADCAGSNKVSDQLLALETLTRRIEEANATVDRTILSKEE